jgi:hypothetical protein
MPAFVYNARLQHDVSKKATFDLEFDPLMTAEVKHRDLQGDFQQPQPTR